MINNRPRNESDSHIEDKSTELNQILELDINKFPEAREKMHFLSNYIFHEQEKNSQKL